MFRPLACLMKVNPEKRFTRSVVLKVVIYYYHVNMWIVSFWHIFHILSYLILFQSLALVPCGGRRKLPRASVVCSYIFSSTGICVGKTLFSYFQFLKFWLSPKQLISHFNIFLAFVFWFIKSNILPVFQCFDP